MRLTVATCLLAMLGMAACSASGGGVHPDPGATRSGAPAGEMTPPPDGMRWQGIHGVVVAIPDSWQTQDQPCARGNEAEVRFAVRNAPIFNCPNLAPGDVPSSAMLVGPVGVQGLADPGTLRHHTTVRGLDVRDGGVRCRASLPSTCTIDFVVPSAFAAFEVTYLGHASKRFVRAVRDSVRPVPDGYTTVPAIAYGTSVQQAKSRLSAAGLSGRARKVPFPHAVIGTLPEAGAVVKQGTSVALTIGDG
jgi:hypothetical protein